MLYTILLGYLNYTARLNNLRVTHVLVFNFLSLWTDACVIMVIMFSPAASTGYIFQQPAYAAFTLNKFQAIKSKLQEHAAQ